MTTPPDPSMMDRISKALAGRYEVRRELGRGGMATVYLAYDHRHDRSVALKVLSSHLGKDGRKRFLSEIRTAANLIHPHILPLHDSGEADGFLYYVMPYVEGVTLDERIRDVGRLDVEEAGRIVREIGSGLGHAHKQGLVHRDVKPSNIFLADGNAFLADFGIAKALESDRSTKLTMTGMSVGTPLYTSPEQATGSDVDGRSDLYSLACVHYQMLTGEPPFTGPNVKSIMAAHCFREPPAVRTARSDVPVHVERAIQRAMAKEPEDRFATMGAYLEAVQGGAPARRRRGAPGLPAGWRAVAWAGAALLVAAAGIWWWRAADEEPAAAADENRTAMAVLPFTTFGPGLEQLSEGMVTLLSTSLDGVRGLRAIDQRTVLSRWGEALRDGAGPDRAGALDIARGLGAEWTVMGSVTSVGEEARFVAEIVRAGSDERVGEVSVEGHRDSLLVTIDDLAREILEVLVERTGSEATLVPLSSLTTRSAEALRSFLAGERHYRHGRMDSAAAEYDRAVEEDSTFALAWFHYSLAHSTANFTMMEPTSLERAYELRDRLPERARLAVVGTYMFANSAARAADTLEYAVRRYPDDPELWFWLGEAYYHGNACRTPEELEAAFTRAIELNPDVQPYWVHPMQFAMGLHRDSALAARRAEALGRAVVSGGNPWGGSEANEDPYIRFAFGDGSAVERVAELLDQFDQIGLDPIGSGILTYVGHPSWWALRDTLLRAIIDRRGPASPAAQGAIWNLLRNDLEAGRLERWREDAARFDPEGHMALFRLAWTRSWGIPIPDSLLRSQLGRVEDAEPGPEFGLVGRTIAAVELDHEEAVPSVERRIAEALSAGRMDSARLVALEIQIEGLRRWRAGDEEGALERLRRASRDRPVSRLWIADLLLATGRPQEAIRCYRNEWQNPIAYRGLGDALAETGRTEEAVEAYRVFLDVWEGADPELQPEVEAVRARVVELTREPTEAAPDRTRAAEADSGDGG